MWGKTDKEKGNDWSNNTNGIASQRRLKVTVSHRNKKRAISQQHILQIADIYNLTRVITRTERG